MEGLAPVFAVIAKLNGRFSGRKSRAPAVHGFHAAGIESFHGLLHGAQVRVEQTNERPPKQKIEAAKRNQGCRIVEQGTGGFLQQSPLFQQAMLHHVAQALALRDFSKDLVQRGAPFQGRDIRLAQHGSQNLRDVIESNIFAIKVLGSAQREVLHQQQIDFVAVGWCLFLFLQLPLQKGPQPLFAGVECFRRKLANLKRAQVFVNCVEPFQVCVKYIARGPLWWQLARRMRKRSEIELRRQRCVQGVSKTCLAPLCGKVGRTYDVS